MLRAIPARPARCLPTLSALASLFWLLAPGATLAGCGEEPSGEVRLTITGSAVGDEAALLSRQLRRFEQQHPGVRVTRRVTPDSADERHQLMVQWLNAHSADPDVLQIDVVDTPELAAAGWLLPIDLSEAEQADLFPAVLEADRFRGRLFALPWFVDVGMLYYRTDLMDGPPETLRDLARTARAQVDAGRVRYGFVWQGARYEGLVTVFVELLGAFGGRILAPDGKVEVGSPAAVQALTALRDLIYEQGVSPEAVLGFREEPARFAFQNGEAAFMRNWPYAYDLMQDPESSAVAGRFAVAPMPRADGGRQTAALGGAQLAINAFSDHPKEARALVAFLVAPEQMVERARALGQLPPRPSLYEGGPLAGAVAMPLREALRIIEAARPRPVTPVYAELSRVLQVHLHRALTRQEAPGPALRAAQQEAQALLDRFGHAPAPRGVGWLWALAVGVALALILALRRRPRPQSRREERLAWAIAAPAVLATVAVAIVPLGVTVYESLHVHDLRLPEQGRVFVGLSNYLEAARSERFLGALANTGAFVGMSVALELALGLALALLLDRAFRGRGLVRAAALVPWALPAVVVALLWRFLFETEAGPVNAALLGTGVTDHPIAWLSDATLAWVPVVLADVWKTTPFVALLLLAGLQGIDHALYEAARVDGAGRLQRFVHITLPLLRPAILVALLFRTLDALRVFGLIYVLTGGGPGTSTEPVSLTTFDVLLQSLRFGYGAALATVVFGLSLGLSMVYVRLLGAGFARGAS